MSATAFDGGRQHDAPGARQHNLARLARRGAVWEPPPVRRRRFWSLWGPLLPIALAVGLLAGALIAAIERGAFSTAACMALFYGALVVT